MSDSCCKPTDPRVRRTRQMLQQALEGLLQSRSFEEISVQDIAEAATVNRATFYDHYPDKFALLECLVGSRFHGLLAGHAIRFDLCCMSAFRAIVLGVCHYLTSMPRLECERQRQLEPHFESAVIAVVRQMFLDGLRQHPAERLAPLELVASAVSWAIYGAVKEWLHTPNRCPAEQMADTVMSLLTPLLDPVSRDPTPLAVSG